MQSDACLHLTHDYPKSFRKQADGFVYAYISNDDAPEISVPPFEGLLSIAVVLHNSQSVPVYLKKFSYVLCIPINLLGLNHWSLRG